MRYTVPLRRETSASPPPTVACASPVPTPSRCMLLSRRRVSRIRKSSSPGRRRAARHKWLLNPPIRAMGKDMARPGLGQDLVTIRASIGRDGAYSADGSGSSPMAVPRAITGPREAITGATRTAARARGANPLPVHQLHIVVDGVDLEARVEGEFLADGAHRVALIVVRGVDKCLVRQL